jgi:hypothetical protein
LIISFRSFTARCDRGGALRIERQQASSLVSSFIVI